MDLDARLESRKAVVGIIGMGYVGLPLAREFCSAKFHVVGFDVDATKVKALMAGKSYIKHIASSVISEHVKAGLLEATTDFSRLRQMDAILI